MRLNLRPREKALDVERLMRLPNATLGAMHQEMFGCGVPAGSYEHARRRIAWQLQAGSEGGLPDSARQYALAIARDTHLRVNSDTRTLRSGRHLRHAMTAHIAGQDSRLPMPGSVIVKEYKHRTLMVKVLDDGFEWDGRKFQSLSAVATHVTGTRWNGLAFFGLTKEKQLG
jgi:Protein of unknown function (DUF2924)